MTNKAKCQIRFKHLEFINLRERLLTDCSREAFAILFAKKETINEIVILNVIETHYLGDSDYHHRTTTHLNIKKDVIYELLSDITNRYDVDTIIDVHTHPFATGNVSFSGTDDHDEEHFFRFLKSTFDNLNYASIVLSQTEYSARLWLASPKLYYENASIKTQTAIEQPKESNGCTGGCSQNDRAPNFANMYDRGILALGLDTIRKIANSDTISIIGVGGTGSIVAEHIVHMGFQKLNLIDPDILEISNLNRIVGAYYDQAIDGQYKVTAVQAHLQKINPSAHIAVFAEDVYSDAIEATLALSDWIFVATDNHSSRLRAQEIAFKYFIPFISLGVNITVANNLVTDISGEVITVRMGDNLCLHCLGRINPLKVAQERSPDESIRTQLVQKGYVTGADVKEPAVKTLNSIVATLAVDVLVNQYSGQRHHSPVLVYESTAYHAIYEDKNSLTRRNMYCHKCNI